MWEYFFLFVTLTCMYLVLRRLFCFYNHFVHVRYPRGDGVVGKHNLK